MRGKESAKIYKGGGELDRIFVAYYVHALDGAKNLELPYLPIYKLERRGSLDAKLYQAKDTILQSLNTIEFLHHHFTLSVSSLRQYGRRRLQYEY